MLSATVVRREQCLRGPQLKSQWHDRHNIQLHPLSQNPERKVHELAFLADLLAGYTEKRLFTVIEAAHCEEW